MLALVELCRVEQRVVDFNDIGVPAALGSACARAKGANQPLGATRNNRANH